MKLVLVASGCGCNSCDPCCGGYGQMTAMMVPKSFTWKKLSKFWFKERPKEYEKWEYSKRGGVRLLDALRTDKRAVEMIGKLYPQSYLVPYEELWLDHDFIEET